MLPSAISTAGIRRCYSHSRRAVLLNHSLSVFSLKSLWVRLGFDAFSAQYSLRQLFSFLNRKTRRGWYKLCVLKNECLKTERKNMKQSTRRTLFLSLIIGLALLAGCEDQESTTRDDDINSHTGGVQQSSPDTGYTEPSVPPQSPPYQREPSQPGGDSDPFPRQPPEVDTVTPGEDKQ